MYVVRYAVTLFVLAVAVAAPAAAAPIVYTVNDLGTTDRLILNGADINNVGQVPLVRGNQSYLYQNGTLTAAGFPPPGNTPARINSAGHVAGSANSVPYLWTGGATATNLPRPGNSGPSFAHGLNDQGVVVGTGYYSTDGPGRYRAVRWQNGSLQDVGPAGSESAAYGINNAGQIVGQAGGTGGYRQGKATSWQDNAVTPLPDLPGFTANSIAFDINNVGAIAGYSNDGVATHTNRATVWQPGPGGGPVTAVALAPVPGLNYSEAYAINNQGVVVGTSMNFDLSVQNGTATIWTAGQPVDLNSLISPDSGWRLYEARSINDAGQIVGLGFLSSDPTISHSFLLTPVPEPATGLTLLAVVGLLAVRRR